MVTNESRVDVLAYLFFVGDRKRTPLPYRAEADSADSQDPWLRLRNEETLTIPALLRLAEAAKERYGFATSS
jgi:glucarate dehydratase